jgi:Ca2+-binding EF-hand superfamily protein
MEAFRMLRDKFNVSDNNSFNQIWSRMDRDRNGCISKQEMAQFLSVYCPE